MARHYDPNQPRVPRGHDGGGQWTDGVPKPLSELAAFLNPRIDGEQEERVQLAFLEEKNPRTRIQVRRPGHPIVQLGLFLYSLWSKDNDEDQQAILAFRSREYRRQGDKTFDLEGVQILTWEEVEKRCGENFRKVQEFTDEEFDKLEAEERAKKEKGEKTLSPQQFGIELHKRVKNRIETSTLEDIYAEISFGDKDGNIVEKDYGERGTTRLDVYNKVNDTTVCVDDIKTGDRRLDFKRMSELVDKVSRNNTNVQQIIVTEMLPKTLRHRKDNKELKQK